MWINKKFFESVLSENKDLKQVNFSLWGARAVQDQERKDYTVQKAKDDLTIDWMRHRINALEKERAILMMKAAGVQLPVPEIVPTRPGTLTMPPDFQTMPSFEDVGDDEAARLGIKHDEAGVVEYVK